MPVPDPAETASSASPRRLRGPALRPWLMAGLTGLAAVGLGVLLQAWAGSWPGFAVAFPATVLAALMWGTGPALATALLCAAGAATPWFAVVGGAGQKPLQVGVFLLSAIVICLVAGPLGEMRRRHRAAPPALGSVGTPLSTWLRMVLLGAVLIPLTIFVAVAWWGLEAARADAEGVASRAGVLTANHARAAFDVAADVAHKTSAISAATDAELLAGNVDLRRRLSDMATGLPVVVNINIWDAAGRPLARSDAEPNRQVQVADRPYFREQRDHPEKLARFSGFNVSEVVSGRQSGKPLMNLALRRPSADGSFRGVVGVALSPDFFLRYYQSLAAEEQRLATFTLVRDDGVVLARWPRDGITRIPEDSEVLHRIRAGETDGTVIRMAGIGRETRLVAFRQVAGYPLYMVAGFSQDAVFARWRHFLLLLAAVLAPITAGLVYVTWVALRKTHQESAMAAALRDETRRRSMAERNMLESQRLETLAVLTGGVAHDFNNLLAIVNASLHLHTRKHPAQADEPQVKAMARAIQSGVRLTRQLLSFTRKQALHPERVALQTWLPAAADLLRTTLGATIELRHDVAADTAAILVDTAELELALINLAVNARHALPKGGHLTIFASNAVQAPQARQGPPAAPQVMLLVRDDGVGIPAELLPRVLEPFFTTRERGTGSGLGLTQVHGLVTQSGGHLQIDSKPGFGTTVKLFFPALEAAEAVRAAEPETEAPLTGKLLLVEDNAEVAASMAGMLQAAGLRVERAASAEDAIARLAATVVLPDVVLSDIAMPGAIDGIELAFQLRDRYPGLPVLLATGYADKLEVANCGGLEVLPKPLSPTMLLRRLRELTRPR
ncbi:response regulator [Xylophilus sp. Kf1]|nr:response regulator [Xylophilus sp. Kf1]